MKDFGKLRLVRTGGIFACAADLSLCPVKSGTIAIPGDALCPPGKSLRFFGFEILRVVQHLTEKYSSFVFPKYMIYSSAFRSDERGVRVVTNVVRNAVDADVRA